jgi:hypothetical protein
MSVSYLEAVEEFDRADFTKKGSPRVDHTTNATQPLTKTGT